jgi:S1-C subfamily serine protease
MFGTFLLMLCQIGCSRKTTALSPVELFQKVSPSVFVVESLGQNGDALMFGSAVAVGNDFLITNCHVVQDSWFLRIRRAKEKWSATLIQAEPDHDLCGLRVGSGQPQQWDPVAEFRQKWPNPPLPPPPPPGYNVVPAPWPNAVYSDEEIRQNLQNPAKFRSAFPNYDGLTDDQIRKDVANHVKPAGPTLSPVDIVPSSELATGERVYAVGAPEELELTFSEGVISALRDTEGVRMIQTSAPISPGSSGGGLFDGAGNLVGITSFYAKEGQNLNFALPGEWVTHILIQSANTAGANHVSVSDTALESTARIEIGLEAVKGKNYQRAESSFFKATRLQQSDAYRAWFELGKMYVEHSRGSPGLREKNSDAVGSFQEAIRLRPDYAEAWSELASIYLSQKEFGQAIRAAKESTRLDTGDKNKWMILGLAYLNNHAYSEAVSSLKQGLQIDPKNVGMLTLLGMAYSGNGDREQVLKIYEQLKVISSSAADSFFQECVLLSSSCFR